MIFGKTKRLPFLVVFATFGAAAAMLTIANTKTTASETNAVLLNILSSSL
jgi:hypothetical protein